MSQRNINIGNVATWIRQTGNVGALADLQARMTAALLLVDPSGASQLILANQAAAVASVAPGHAYKPQINVAALRDYIAGVQAVVGKNPVIAGTPSVKFISSSKKLVALSGDPFSAVVAGNTIQVYGASNVANDKKLTVASAANGIAPAIHTVGTGLSDITAGGTYSGTGNNEYDVVIDAASTPDTFKWRKNTGSYTTGVAITGSAQTLSDGVTVTFGATTGHTNTDAWKITTPIIPVATQTITDSTDTAATMFVMSAANLILQSRAEDLASLLVLINNRLN